MSSNISKYTPISYHPLAFVATSLPANPLDKGEIWVKTNGAYTLVLSPTAITTKDGYENTLPSGKIARALLHYITTEARRTGSNRIELPSSHRKLVEQLGVTATGASVQETVLQLRKLLSMSIYFNATGDAPDVSDTTLIEDAQFHIARRASLKLSKDTTKILPGSIIELSDVFMEEMVHKHIFPVDDARWHALVKATKSPLALDIYLWLAYRLPNLREDQEISWEALHQQFGSQQADIKNFRPKFLAALGTALEHYPQAKVVEIGKGSRGAQRKGLRLSRSAPALSKAKLRELMEQQEKLAAGAETS